MSDHTGTYHLYYGDETGSPGTILTFLPWGRMGTGSVHHVAYRTPDDPSEARGTDPSQAEAALILLHGRGASAESILGLAGELQTDGLTVVAPQAEGNTWYPQSFLAPLEVNRAGVDRAVAVIDSLVDDLERKGLARERIVLGGFSQGACLALHYAFTRPARYGAVVALSGGLIGPPGTVFEPAGDFDGTPVFLGCSDVDPHIPAERVRESHEAFSAAGARSEMQLYPGMPHTVNADEIGRVDALIAEARG